MKITTRRSLTIVAALSLVTFAAIPAWSLVTPGHTGHATANANAALAGTLIVADFIKFHVFALAFAYFALGPKTRLISPRR